MVGSGGLRNYVIPEVKMEQFVRFWPRLVPGRPFCQPPFSLWISPLNDEASAGHSCQPEKGFRPPNLGRLLALLTREGVLRPAYYGGVSGGPSLGCLGSAMGRSLGSLDEAREMSASSMRVNSFTTSPSDDKS